MAKQLQNNAHYSEQSLRAYSTVGSVYILIVFFPDQYHLK